MRPALLLPVLLIGLCSRRGVGTSTNSPTVASASATKSSTTVKSSTLAPISTRPTDALRTTSLSTVSITVHVPPISAKTPEVTSSRASVGTHSETPRVTGLTTKPSPLATTVRASIPPMSSPTTKPSSSAAAAKGTTPAGGASPGHTTSPSLSSKTTGKVTSPGGPNTTSVMTLSSKEPTTQTTKSHLATEVLATTPTESSGSQGPATAVSPNATPHVSSAGTKVTMRTTSASTTRHAPPLATDSSGTHPAQSELICEKVAPDESQVVILTLNESTTCESVKNSPLEGKLLNSVCQAVTPSFNWSRDQCTVRMAYAAEDTKHLAIIEVSVRTNSAAKQLFDSLTLNKEELEKIGVSNITHSGRTEDIHVEDRFSMPLIITIVCMAASLLLVAAIYGCCHQRLSQKKDQQRLTEELQTMDNGYHDNPTLEVMETSSEMQEKKLNLNGELGDSWIVPMDNLTREDLEEEEDTHL